MRYEYALIVDGSDEDGYTAALYELDSPLRGFGESPLQAIRQLCETIKEWPISSADRWLASEQSDALRVAVGAPPRPRTGPKPS